MVRAVAVDELEGRHAAGGDEHERGGDAREHIAEVAALTRPVQVGEEDRDDHRGLDALSQEDHEGGDHECPAPRSCLRLLIRLG